MISIFIKNNIDDKLLINRILQDIEVFSYFYDIIIISDARLVDEIESIKEKSLDFIIETKERIEEADIINALIYKHLKDLKSKDVLKEALLQFDGTLILVSHDRDFLQGLSEKVFEFKEKRIIEHFETIDDFLQRNRIENLKEIDLKV